MDLRENHSRTVRPVRSPLAPWLSCHSHRANHFDKGWGQRAYRYLLSPNPEVRHSGFHFIARAIPTPSFQSIQGRPPLYALSSIPRCPARPPDASQGYAPEPEERRRACTGGSDELNACYLVKKILGFHAVILEPPWSLEPDDGPSLLRHPTTQSRPRQRTLPSARRCSSWSELGVSLHNNSLPPGQRPEESG